jgi:uncharacterized membrane protein
MRYHNSMKRIYSRDIDEVDLLSNNAGNDRPLRLLYAGDDDIDRAAGYFACVMHDLGWEIDYICSEELPPSELCDPAALSRYDLIVLSDFGPDENHSPFMEAIASAHHRGVPFLMIGGWGSFCGDNNWYLGNPVADILPVDLRRGDDRVNHWQGIALSPAPDAPPALADLPWDRPPLVAGCNRLIPGRNSRVLLTGAPLQLGPGGTPATAEGEPEPPLPLLIRRDRSWALAFDLAPHWIAGMVDWGNERRSLELGRAEYLPGSEERGVFPAARKLGVEVGNYYIAFIRNLIEMIMEGNDGRYHK